MNILCLSSEFKGIPFFTSSKKNGANIYLITGEKNRNKPWPNDCLEEIFYVKQEGEPAQWNMEDIIAGTAHFLRSVKIDRIVALDDYEVEKAAELREHFRIPGMGQSTQRHFRDKLGMRMKAKDEGVPHPAFSSLFNDEQINHFANTVSAPWVVKPRGAASAQGITKCHSKEELWEVIHKLGDERHQYLVEQFKPGHVYHVDSLSKDGKVLFTRCSQYLETPLNVVKGGVFSTHVMPYSDKDTKELQKLNKSLLSKFGLIEGASHSEFIKCHDDGKFYFLETSSRVGGAHIAEMVEFSSGMGLWSEWANIEYASHTKKGYKLPKIQKDYAGLIVSLSRFEKADYSKFTDPEICWKIDKPYHVGIIIKSKSYDRVRELLEKYTQLIGEDFLAKG